MYDAWSRGRKKPQPWHTCFLASALGSETSGTDTQWRSLPKGIMLWNVIKRDTEIAPGIPLHPGKALAKQGVHVPQMGALTTS